MEKKTIGGFLAALRKTNGMTQQEVADRLNVSNKTISKWERDESYPDITLIPVLAELFQVTSDEILRGERIIKQETDTYKSEAKTEKQIKRIIESSMVKYKNVSIVAISITLLGLICFFIIAYSFFRPDIAYGVFLFFVVLSSLVEAILINQVNVSLQGNELLLEKEDALLLARAKKYKYAYHVFYLNFIAVISLLPYLVLKDTFYLKTVLSFRTFLKLVPLLVIINYIVYKVTKYFFEQKISRTGDILHNLYPQHKKLFYFNVFQCALFATVYLSLFLAKRGLLGSRTYAIGLLGPILVCILSTILYTVINKGLKLKVILMLSGIRNLIYGLLGIYLVMGISYWMNRNEVIIEIPNINKWILFSIIITIIYEILRIVMYNRTESKNNNAKTLYER